MTDILHKAAAHYIVIITSFRLIQKERRDFFYLQIVNIEKFSFLIILLPTRSRYDFY